MTPETMLRDEIKGAMKNLGLSSADVANLFGLNHISAKFGVGPCVIDRALEDPEHWPKVLIVIAKEITKPGATNDRSR